MIRLLLFTLFACVGFHDCVDAQIFRRGRASNNCCTQQLNYVQNYQIPFSPGNIPMVPSAQSQSHMMPMGTHMLSTPSWNNGQTPNAVGTLVQNVSPVQTIVSPTQGVVSFNSAGLPVISNSAPSNAFPEYSVPVPPSSLTPDSSGLPIHFDTPQSSNLSPGLPQTNSSIPVETNSAEYSVLSSESSLSLPIQNVATTTAPNVAPVAIPPATKVTGTPAAPIEPDEIAPGATDDSANGVKNSVLESLEPRQ